MSRLLERYISSKGLCLPRDPFGASDGVLSTSCLLLGTCDDSKAIRRNASGEPSIAQETRLGDLYAVVVGVSRYANPRVPSLKFADKDARDVAEFLKSQDKLFRRIHVTLLLNEQATSAEVKKHLVYELRRADKDDNRGMIASDTIKVLAGENKAPFDYVLGCRMRKQKEVTERYSPGQGDIRRSKITWK